MIVGSIPSPIRGLNTSDIASTFDPTEAVELVNWFPENKFVRLRRSFSVATNTALGSSKDVPSLMQFVSEGGATVKLIAGANSAIYDVSGATPSSVTLPASYSITNNYWDTTNFTDSGGSSYLVMCNGSDNPLLYNGSALAKTAWTGITQTKLLVPLAYKGRLYFIEKDSLSIWYGGTGVSGASSSALTEFNLSSIFSKSGKLVWHGAWSFDFGNGLNDYYALVTSEGEFLLYGGIYPGDSGWGLLTRGTLPSPISSRCFAKFGNDVLVLCSDGEIYSFASLVQKNWKSVSMSISSSIVELIDRTGTTSASAWSLFVSQRKQKIYIIAPVGRDSGTGKITSTKIFAGNLQSFAWCEYVGCSHLSFCEFGKEIYTGASDGYIYNIETDDGYDSIYVSGSVTQVPIYTKLRTAPIKFSQENKRVQALAVKPLFVGSGDISYDIGCETDLETYSNLSVAADSREGISGGLWDTGLWDDALWYTTTSVSKRWRRVHGLGVFVSVRMEALFKSSVVNLSEISVGYINARY